MFTLAKQLITEKDLFRKITILENLLHHPQMTTKDLALQLQVSQRTIFNDLQGVRLDLPPDWQLVADGNQGLTLNSQQGQGIQEIWELYLQQTLAMTLLKGLLMQKRLGLTSFLMENGVSVAYLKRQVKKMNHVLAAFQLQIRLNSDSIWWQGEESNIRIFYHRLLVPFTHHHFFFADYVVHESNYQNFLKKLQRQQLGVATEEIFGTCWFFLNTIRIKAGCPIEGFAFDEDPLYQIYLEYLQEVYGKEGISLQQEEAFFAYFCFLESWSYLLSPVVSQRLRDNYPHLFTAATAFLQQLGVEEQLVTDPALLEDLVLFQVKYYESKQLSDKFLREYAEVLALCQERFSTLFDQIAQTLEAGGLAGVANVSQHAVSNLVLLVQTAQATHNTTPLPCYFVYQGEPAWKQFLLTELQDLAGRRVAISVVDSQQLAKQPFTPETIVLTNYPLDFQCPARVVYLSTIPTTNELAEFKKLLQHRYL